VACPSGISCTPKNGGNTFCCAAGQKCREPNHDACVYTTGNVAEPDAATKTALNKSKSNATTCTGVGCNEPAPHLKLAASQGCAGEYATAYTYKNGGLVVIRGYWNSASCRGAYDQAKRCLGSFDNDTVTCPPGPVLACAPYTVCQ
jgi:hypothetical protein